MTTDTQKLLNKTLSSDAGIGALALGLLTRPAAIVAAFTMLMAMTVHLGNGMFLSNNGYEFALTLLAVTTALAFMGGGAVSVDSRINTHLLRQADPKQIAV